MTKIQPRASRSNPDQTAPLIAALNLIGDGWTFLILRELFFGVNRFEDIRETLTIPRSRLTERLQNMIDGGVLIRRPYQSNPPRYEYRLTQMGLDIYEMSLAEKSWADKWRVGRFPHLTLYHRTCGSILIPVMQCRSCHEKIRPKDIEKINDQPIVFEGRIINKRRSIPNDIYDRGTRREAVMETLKVMGDQHSIMILHEAFRGVTRFDDFHVKTGIARNTLTSRLQHLVREGVFEKKPSAAHSGHLEYCLTLMGWDLLLVELALEQWGRNWLCGTAPPIPTYRHKTCGNALEIEMVCRSCTFVIDPKSVDLKN